MKDSLTIHPNSEGQKAKVNTCISRVQGDIKDEFGTGFYLQEICNLGYVQG